MKKLISLLLSVAMICTLLVVPASAEDGPYIELKTSPATIEVDGTAKTVTIEVVLHNPTPTTSKVSGVSFDLASESNKVVIAANSDELATAFGGAKYLDGSFTAAKINMSSYEAEAITESRVTLMKIKATIAADATPGDYMIKATNVDVANTSAVSLFKSDVTCTIKLTPKHYAVTSVSLNKSSTSIQAGQTETLVATVAPDNATNKSVTWTSSNEKVATVENGVVTAKAVGTATITVKTVDGNKTATCKVTVTCAHNYIEQQIPEAVKTLGNCATKTEYYKSCQYCKALDTANTFQGDVVADNHQAPFTVKHDDTQHWNYCERCKQQVGEKQNHNHIKQTANCSQKNICSVCNAEWGDFAANKHDNVELKHDTTKHWDYCKDCKKDLTATEEEHFSNNAANKATCQKLAVCDKCGVSYGDYAKHTLKETPAKVATCTAEGNIQYWTCSVCHKNFKDADAKQVADKITTDKIAHNYGGWATSTTEHWKACKACGLVSDKAAHTYDETTGKCVCGAVKDPVVAEDHKDHKTADNSGWHYDANSHWHLCGETNCAGHLDEAKHTLTKQSTVTDGGKQYDVMTCTCGYVTRVEVKNTNPGTTGGNGNNANAKNPYEKNDTTKKDNGKTVESGRTFDAGIALYVGLSLLSVTGGALVIGKKKEF